MTCDCHCRGKTKVILHNFSSPPHLMLEVGQASGSKITSRFTLLVCCIVGVAGFPIVGFAQDPTYHAMILKFWIVHVPVHSANAQLRTTKPVTAAKRSKESCRTAKEHATHLESKNTYKLLSCCDTKILHTTGSLYGTWSSPLAVRERSFSRWN